MATSSHIASVRVNPFVSSHVDARVGQLRRDLSDDVADGTGRDDH